MEKLSQKLVKTLVEVELEIERYIVEHKFYLDFRNKAWAACPQGQALMSLTILATNLRYNIETLRSHNL